MTPLLAALALLAMVNGRTLGIRINADVESRIEAVGAALSKDSVVPVKSADVARAALLRGLDLLEQQLGLKPNKKEKKK